MLVQRQRETERKSREKKRMKKERETDKMRTIRGYIFLHILTCDHLLPRIRANHMGVSKLAMFMFSFRWMDR